MLAYFLYIGGARFSLLGAFDPSSIRFSYQTNIFLLIERGLSEARRRVGAERERTFSRT